MTASNHGLGRLPVAALIVGDDGDRVLAANDRAVTLLGSWPDRLQQVALAGLFQEASDAPSGSARGWIDRAHPPARFVELAVGERDPDGTRVATVRDITEDAVYERLAYHAGQSILVLDREGSLRQRFFGRLDEAETSDLIGDNMLTRLHPEDLIEVIEGAAWLTEAPGRRLRTTARARGQTDPTSWQFLALDAVAALDDPHLEGYVAFLNLVDEDIPTSPLGRSVGTSLAELVPIGILVTDHAGHAVYANALARDLLPTGDTGSEVWFDTFPGPDRERVLDLLTAARHGRPGALWVHPTTGEATSSRWLRVAVSGGQVVDGELVHPLLVVTVEATDDDQSGTRPDDLLARAAFDALPPLAVVDRTGRIERANGSLAQLLGERSERGRSIREWLDDPLGSRLLDWLTAVAEASELRPSASAGDTRSAPAASWPSPGEFHGPVSTTAGPVDAVLRATPAVDANGSSLGFVLAVDFAAQPPSATTRPTDAQAEPAGDDVRRAVDSLTGLPARHEAMVALQSLIDHSGHLGVALCEVVRNDAADSVLGPVATDDLLTAIADRLRALPAEAAAYRIGPDRFILLSAVLHPDHLRRLLHEAMAGVDALDTLGGGGAIAVRIGAAGAPGDGTDGPAVLVAAVADAQHRAAFGSGAP